MQTYYPEFESGQVLTNAHLNELGTWLNEQQQASRRKLLGIGIVCGLEAIRAGTRIDVGKGVAVTSAGHLACLEQARSHGRFRPYQLPVSGATEDDLDTLTIEVPELLPLPDLQLWELLTDDFAPAPGEPAPGNLSAAFLADKVVLLLLEVTRESLKNCDINDCSNKGARWVHTLRILLIKESDAKDLWQAETADSTTLLPRDLEWQEQRGKLAPVTMGKLPLALAGAGSLQEIHELAVSRVAAGWQQLRSQLQGSFAVYGHLLRERFPAEDFPLDPWVGLNPVPAAQAPNLGALLLDLHRYDMLQDAMASWQEFLEAACDFEALCCPDPRRFPFHILLGKPLPAPAAEQPGNRSFEQIDFNLGAQTALPYLRHPFYPAMQPGRQQQRADGMLDLYYRTWLLFHRYRSDGLLEGELRISPSRKSGPLSRKALPYYFALTRNDDLHRNWHPHATRCGRLAQVHGHALIDDKQHPLTQVPDDSDFYRVEGLVGRPLGQALAALKTQQRQLGIGFGIEPVFLPVQKIASDSDRGQLLALLQREQTLQRLFKCKLGDIDIIFLLLLGFIFQLLLALVYLISRMGQGSVAGSEATPGKRSINPAFMAVNVSELSMALNSGDQAGLQATLQSNLSSNSLSTFLQKQVREGRLQAADLIQALDEPDDRNGPNAQIYLQAKAQGSGDLLQRVRKVVGTNASEQQVQQTYQSVRMLQQAETMLQQSAATSVAQFDFDRFDSNLAELQASYQSYRAQVPAGAGGNQSAMQAALDSNMNTLGNVSGSALLSNLRNEFVARISKIFSEFMFDGYNQRFPGLEHLCGVPKGGTLVLAYTHKSLLQQKAPQRELGGANRLTANVAALQPAGMTLTAAVMASARTEATVANRAGTSAAANTAVLAEAEKASALRAEREARLVELETSAKKSEQQVSAASKTLDSSRKELEKAQATRERLDRTTSATAADKRAATATVKENETRVATETEKLKSLQVTADKERDQVTIAARELEEARKAEEKALLAAREASRADAAEAAAASSGGGLAAASESATVSAATASASVAGNRLTALLADDDPLNNLIIVADFCLPTYCCDSDCADLIPAPPVSEPPRDTPANPISVSGSIVGSAVLTHFAPEQLLANAKLKVVERNGQDIPVKMTRGSFLFKVNPGTYTLTAAADGYQSRQETMDIKAPLGQDLVISLKRG